MTAASATVSIWTDLATLAMRPGGWFIPVLALLCFFLALWAVFDRCGAVVTERTPRSFTGGRIINVEHSKRTHAAFHRPKSLQSGPRRIGSGSTPRAALEERNS